MTIRSQITSNIVKSYVFMALCMGLLVLLAYVFGQATGYGNSFIGMAFFISLGSTFVSFFFGDQIVLAMSGARPASRKKDFDFFTVTENLSIAAGLPMPKLYVIEDSAMNAFATGRDPNHAIICATTGLLTRLNRREIEGVVAHELSHIKNYDIRIMLIVAVLAGTIAYAADFFMRTLWWGDRDRNDRGGNSFILIVGILSALLAPLAATLIQLAISRKREYLADASGALLTRYPEGLASALEKISSDKEPLKGATHATAHLFIADPFKGKNVGSWVSGLFHTHPPAKERIKILRSM